MRIAMLSPIAWRTPPRHYGPWESVVSLLTEGLVARGFEVTLFATADSETKGKLHAVCQKGYEEDRAVHPKVWECLHISELFEQADKFDLIHNHFDYLPLTYSDFVQTPVISTIHGFSSPMILPVYKKYNGKVYYVSISDADRSPELDYAATIHHGIDLKNFHFQSSPEDYLLFFGRIHHDKGTKEAIEIAKACRKKLIIAGIIQDREYYRQHVQPFCNNHEVIYIGSADPIKRNRLLGNAYALLHPINFDEPFGLSVIESMACGTPVIACNRGSMPELIEHGKNGFLVLDKDEAVKAVASVKDIDRAYCRKSVEKTFTAEDMIEKYIHTYEQILVKPALRTVPYLMQDSKNDKNPAPYQNQRGAANRRVKEGDSLMKKGENYRPWGYYIVLSDEERFKVKKIVVYSGKRLSLQRHKRRAEHWHIVQGRARITLDNNQLTLSAGQSLDIPQGALHRIENIGQDELSFIEVQTGEYFGEDDIERIQDDFGRR